MTGRLSFCVLGLSLALTSCRTSPRATVTVSATDPQLLVGSVVDSRTRSRLTDAVVELAGLAKVVRVDSLGGFRLTDVPKGLVTVRTRRLGYHPGEGTIVIDRADSLLVKIGLDRITYCLDYCQQPVSTSGYVRITR